MISTERLEAIVKRPMFHPFKDTAACIRNLAAEVIRLRKENYKMANWIAAHTVNREGE